MLKKYFKSTPLFLTLGILGAALLFFFESKKEIPIRVVSVEGSVQLRHEGVWTAAGPGTLLESVDILQTGENSSAVLQFPGTLTVRIEAQTKVSAAGPGFKRQQDPGRLVLLQGSILAASGRVLEPAGKIIVTTPRAVCEAEQAFFKIEVNPERDGREWYGVLRGRLTVVPKAREKGPALLLAPLEKFENLLTNPDENMTQGFRRQAGIFNPLQKEWRPEKLDVREWQAMARAYELNTGDPRSRPRLENFKDADNFFKRVQQNGIFYGAGKGYFESAFFPGDGPRDSIARFFYDLYPQGSFAGIRFKARERIAEETRFLSFQARRVSGESPPETFFVELKSGRKAVKTFELQGFTDAWNTFSLPLIIEPAVSWDEVVFLLKPDRAGPAKQGMLELKNLRFAAAR